MFAGGNDYNNIKQETLGEIQSVFDLHLCKFMRAFIEVFITLQWKHSLIPT